MYQCGLVNIDIDIATIYDSREGLHARGQSFQFISHIAQRFAICPQN